MPASTPLPQQQQQQLEPPASNQSAQQAFQTRHDNSEDPSQSIDSYMRSLHEYTKSQLETINRSTNSPSRRTDASAVSQTATLTHETSVGSVDSIPE